MKHKNQNNKISKNKAKCPICQNDVKYPSKLSYLSQNLQCIQRQQQHHPQTKSQEKQHDVHPFHPQKHTAYLTHFLSSKAFPILCEVQHHAMNNKSDITKEVTESWSIYSALSTLCQELNVGKADEEELCFVDLCCGKGLTTGLLSVLYPQSTCVAVDLLGMDALPHFMSSCAVTATSDNHVVEDDKSGSFKNDDMPSFIINNATYWKLDIMKDSFQHDLASEFKTVEKKKKVPILVGMHLCGNLSLRAIELFQNITEIRGIVLAPCCLPKKKKTTKKKNSRNIEKKDEKEGNIKNGGKSGDDDIVQHDFFDFVEQQDGTAATTNTTTKDKSRDEWYMYNQWSKYLYNQLHCSSTTHSSKTKKEKGCKMKETLETNWYIDLEIHSKKNSIVTCIRK
jgi:hypothetical protein